MKAAEQWLKFVTDDLMNDCIALDIFYQPTRYPEAPTGSLPEGLPNKEQAEETLQKAKGIFEFVRQRIATVSLPSDSSQQLIIAE